MLGGRVTQTRFGQCLVIDRRYEADSCHGTIRVGDCDRTMLAARNPGPDRVCCVDAGGRRAARTCRMRVHATTLFIDLETTG